MRKVLLLLVTILLFSIFFVSAQENEVVLYKFYKAGCQHCAKLALLLEDLQEKYPSLIVKDHEIHDDDSRALLEEMAAAYGEDIDYVPIVFIDDKSFVGFAAKERSSIEQEVQRCTEESCISPIEKVTGRTKISRTVTIPAVISAATVDAINPCAFAVLIILLTTILAAGIRKRALMAGIAFTVSIYISYFLMGIGLYSAIQASGLTHTFYTIVAILAIIVGLFNLKDYLWYGKWFKMEVPMSWRPKLKRLLQGVTSVPGAFLIGFAVSLFLLPCTSGPYIVILGLLAKITTRNYALMLLLLYNFIFILPMLIITSAIYFGFTTTKKAEEWRTKKLEVLHLIAGIIILCLGVGMFIAMWLGMV
jgi:cytochrome c biogenesis protein CcdA/glutaredoxin